MNDDLNDSAVADRTADSAPARSDSAPSRDTQAPERSDSGGDQAETRTTPAKAEDIFGDNWRDQWVAALPEDERNTAKGWLSKRSSPHEVLRAGLYADRKIQEVTQGRVKLPTGKDDDPKEVSQFRKAWGIPEKAEDYKAEVPKEIGELSNVDQELLAEFKERAHKKNFSQAQFNDSLEMYWAVDQRVKAARQAEAIRLDMAGEDEVRNELGRNFRPDIELTNRFFADRLGKHGWDAEQRKEFLAQRLENGQKLGSFPPFVKMMVELAREQADDGAFDIGESSDGVDLDKKIDDIVSKSQTDPKEYERLQPELKRLIAAQQRRDARRR